MILGLHSAGHDAGAALVDGNGVVAVIESERLTRMRHESRVRPAIDYLFAEYPEQASCIESIAVSTPVRYGELDLSSAAAGVERLDLQEPLLDTAASVRGQRYPCRVIIHEYCHLACAMHAANWRPRTLVLVNEGHGSVSRNCTFYFDGHDVHLCAVNALPWYASGFGWNAVAYLAGFEPTPSVAGTIMALAGFGMASERCEDVLRRVSPTIWEQSRDEQLAIADRVRSDVLRQGTFKEQADLAATLQRMFTEAVLEHILSWQAKVPVDHVALGGGCALNIVANSVIRARCGEISVWPACNDAGVALGAALWSRFCSGVCSGNGSGDIRCAGATNDLRITPDLLGTDGWQAMPISLDRVVHELARGGVVAWAAGKPAVGPRSLGERSFLASPVWPGNHRVVSSKIKKRLWFRPLSPVVRLERFADLFPGELPSPAMLHQYDATGCGWPEATHADGTARIQTLAQQEQPQLYALLEQCERAGVCDALINTSLNSRGDAMSHTSKHVLTTAAQEGIRMAVLDDTLLVR